MSTRTIIEINHDELAFLEQNGQTIFPTMLQEMRSGVMPVHIGNVHDFAPGVRILGQRHHTEPEFTQGENLSCKSTQKRLATQWGFVPAGVVEPSAENIERAVGYAQAVTLGSEYPWPDYMRDLWRVMAGGMPTKSIAGWFAPSTPALPVVYTNKWGQTVRVSIEAAAKELCAYDNAWPGGLDEIDAAIDGNARVAFRKGWEAAAIDGVTPAAGSPEFLKDMAEALSERTTAEADEVAHDDHPGRHWSRNCPACNPSVSQGVSNG